MSLMKMNRISPRRVLYFFLLVPFFPVQSIQMLGSQSNLWIIIYNVLAILRLIVAASSIFVFLVKRRKPDILTWGVIATEVMTFVACIKNGSLTFQFSLTMCMATVGFAMLCQCLDQKNANVFLKANLDFFGLLCMLGVMSIIIFPDGFNHSPQKQFAIWFLGSKNAAYFYYAQFLFLICYEAKKKNKAIPGKAIVYVCIFIATTLICKSSNGTLMLLIILCGMLLMKYKSFFRRLFTPKKVILYVIVLAASIPALSSGAFDWAFKLIGRTSDFSMRTFIWDSAIVQIKENPLFGNGKDGDVMLFGGQTHAHNFYLDIAVKYGLVTIILLLITITIIALKMRKTNNKGLLTVGSLFLLTLLIHGLFDITSMYYMILLLHFLVQIPNKKHDRVFTGNRLLYKGYSYANR